MIVATFKFQLEALKRNTLVGVLIAITALGVLYVGILHDAIPQALGYLGAMWLCSFCIDLFTLGKYTSDDFPVRNPKKESLYFIICLLLGLVFFAIRFSGAVDWEHLPGMVRLLTVPLIAFVYPIGLAIIMLLLKYSFSQLGIRLQGFLAAIPVIAISIVTSRLVAPQNLTWDIVLTESGGFLGMLFSGFIAAGLSEEFFRLIGQTRFGALFNNKGLGWFVTTVIWALLHAPKWYSENHDVAEVLLSSMRIIPIGLMWGYLTHRTKSILPSVLVHGTNFWGLQNF